MILSAYLALERGRGAAIARGLQVKPVMVSQWAHGCKPVPPTRCTAIEKVTGGAVTRRDLRPDDWQEIWPELATPPNTSSKEATNA